MKRTVTLLIAVGAVVSLSATSFATIIHVPADQPTIQAGIDAAVPGDTVLVADGTYTGNGNRDIDFGGKGVVLKSENGPDFTIIDCQGSSADPHRVFYFHSGEDSTAVVDGFTIQGGWGIGYGAGIYCSGSSPTISNNTISGNSGSAGGGIYCRYNSNPTISNNAISGNWASSGAGIYCWSSSPTISSNTISGNSAYNIGGGISCLYSSPTISNNTISGNSVSGLWGGGGGIYCWSSSPTISNNTISGNSAGYDCHGGGIYCRYNSNPTISNNTISGNSTESSGGGIFCGFHSSPTISNNTICDNSASSCGGIYSEEYSNPTISNTIIAFSSQGEAVYCGGTSNPSLTCCDVYGNAGGDWVGCIAGQAGINGNFSLDPIFCDIANDDYHIAGISPCAADNNSCGVLIGALDVECDYVCGDANGDSLVTMDDVAFLQAYYFECSTPPFPCWASDLNCDGSVDIADIVYLAQFLNGTGPEPCCW